MHFRSPILNPRFTPDAKKVLQNLTNRVSAELASNPALAATVLSRRQIIAATFSRKVAIASYGRAVEGLVADSIARNPMLSSMFRHVGLRPNSPDFIGLGMYQRLMFDITTLQRAAAHLSRPYGNGLHLIFYMRPPTFP